MANCKIFSVGIRLLSLTPFILAFAATTLRAQNSECRDDIKRSDGFRVRSVKIEARGGWVPGIVLPIKAGDIFNPAELLPSFEAVRNAIKNDEANQSFELESRGEVSVLWIVSCVKIVDPTECRSAFASSGGADITTGAPTDAGKCVDVAIQPAYLRLDMFKVGSNTLPIPRSNRPTFYSLVPRPLLALNPQFGTSYDREYGFSEMGAVSTNLLDLPDVLRGDPVSSRDVKLDLAFKGRKSVDESFYNTHSSLSLSRRKPGSFLEEAAVEGSFDADQMPLGEGKHFRNIGRLGASLSLRLGLGLLDRFTLGGKYRWGGNRFFSSDGSLSEMTTEEAFEGRLLVDGRIAGGFTRLGVWTDASSPEDISGSYRRVAGVIGYQKEFGRTSQTVGVELIAGAGRARGGVPEYARFFGGNSLGSFLYDAPDSPSLTAFPQGPLLRSFGTGQAGARMSASATGGGTSYWHVNANVSIPIPAWSRDLIPAIDVLGDGQSGIRTGTLKDIIKGQVNTAESFLALRLKEELMDAGVVEPEAEAQSDARAAKIIRQIRPAVNFIADKANIYAVKPLIMVDAGRIGAPGGMENRMRVAFGGGLQLTVVIAKFEAGYIRTVRRVSGDPRGNFVMRLVFQNLF